MKFFIALVLLLSPIIASSIDKIYASNVYSKAGDIYYSDSKSALKKITRDGINKDPVLSNNREEIIFIKQSGAKIPSKCCCSYKTGTASDEIWLYDLSKSKLKRLVSSNINCNPINYDNLIININKLAFSPNGHSIYFQTTAAMTSASLKVYNIRTHTIKLFAPSNDYYVIGKGPNKGYLVILQHRYWLVGGSYDWYWLYSPNGNIIGPLGDDYNAEIKNDLESYKVQHPELLYKLAK